MYEKQDGIPSNTTRQPGLWHTQDWMQARLNGPNPAMPCAQNIQITRGIEQGRSCTHDPGQLELGKELTYLPCEANFKAQILVLPHQ